ncbi:MAG: hypothetical protein ABIH50_00090 [bacterium]
MKKTAIIASSLFFLLLIITSGCQTAQMTTTTTSTTTTTIPKETSFGGLTLGMTTSQVTSAWGTPSSTSVSGLQTNYSWTTQEGSTTRTNRAATFLTSTGKLILIGQNRIGDSLLSINFLDLSGEVTSRYGTPECKTIMTGYPTGELWVYNSRNIAYKISTSSAWLSKVVALYVLDGTLYVY